MKQFTQKLSVAVISSMLVLSACNKNDDIILPPTPNDDPILLDCDYFANNPDAVLKDNPNAPIDYIVPCVMSINNHVTIQSGVTIAFETDAGFSIKTGGSLNAVGSSGGKITFTGVNKSVGSWRGIMFGSNEPKNEISHCIIEYAGGKAFNSNGDLGAVIIWSGARTKFNNNTVQYSKAYGLNVAYDGATAENISGNIFKENNIPLTLSVRTIEELKANNKYEANTTNKVEVYPGDMDQDITVSKIDVPYMFVEHRGAASFLNRANFDIQPGTIIEVGQGIDFKTSNTSATYNIVGTPQERIIIRGLLQQPGSWGYIYITSSSPLNRIEYADIMHAGNQPTTRKGAIYINGRNQVHVANTNFKDILSCAVFNVFNDNTNFTTGSNITYTNCGGQLCSN